MSEKDNNIYQWYNYYIPGRENYGKYINQIDNYNVNTLVK